jgi:ABC-type multidrug transport system fused ATPase/permease subunit
MVSHRINFLMKCNKIIVFSKGKIIQFDTPENLIKDKNNIFYKLYSLSINQ